MAKTKKKGRGRPPVKNPRHCFLSIRVNEKERRQFESGAKKAGMSLQNYARMRLCQ